MNLIRKTLLLSLIFIFCIFNVFVCKDDSVAPQPGNSAQEIEATLESLEKIENYPFYTMTYFGDYGFDEYLLTGSSYPGAENYPLEKNYQDKIEGLFSKAACTCFAAMGTSKSKVFGRNFDFNHRATLLLFTNPPDAYASVAMVDMYYCGYDGAQSLATLKEREILLQTPHLPFDGMNEHGVTIGMMAVPYSEPPYDPKKVTIYELAVIRLVLDYAKTTDEAVSLIEKYNVAVGSIPVHFLIADPSGQSAVIEFVNGKMEVIRNSEPWQVSTNFIIHGSKAPEQTSCWRYNTAYSDLKKVAGKITQDHAMTLLNSVSQSNTMWSVVFDMSRKNLLVTVGRNFNNVYQFELKN